MCKYTLKKIYNEYVKCHRKKKPIHYIGVKKTLFKKCYITN